MMKDKEIGVSEGAFLLEPNAVAIVKGSKDYSGLEGSIYFCQTEAGVIVAAEVKGLPWEDGRCKERFHGFHIHSGGSCSGTQEEPFKNAEGHFNPDGCAHPMHAGDLPPLLSNYGYAWMMALTAGFTVDEVIGKTVIIHKNPDDFISQPSGNAGEMIGCGVIEKF